ncbi:MAG: hypothetical protein ACLQU2_01325, partial [Candidatus Binataceae bacterium]
RIFILTKLLGLAPDKGRAKPTAGFALRIRRRAPLLLADAEVAEDGVQDVGGGDFARDRFERASGG